MFFLKKTIPHIELGSTKLFMADRLVVKSFQGEMEIEI